MKAPQPLGARRTVSWGLLDQVMASGQTFLFVVIAARALTASELGAVAFTFELYLLAVFAARGLAGDPLLSRYSGRDDAGLRAPVRASSTTAVLMGVLVGAMMACVGVLADPPLRGVLFVAAIAMPGLTLQDYVRSALIVQGRVRSTFINDTIWTVGQIPVMILAIEMDPSAPTVFGAWAATGCTAALIGLLQLRSGLAPLRTVREWLRENRDLWPYYLGDNLLYEGTSLLLLVVVSSTAGLAATAGFRVAMTIYAPLSLVGRGIIAVSVTMLAQRRDNPAVVRQRAMLISLILTPLAIGFGVLTLLVPDKLGAAFFGDSWVEAEPLVFLASFVCAAGLFSTGVSIGLRALSAGRQTLVGRLIVSVGASVAAAIGGLTGGVYGLFVALAVFFPVQIVVWWLLLRHATHNAQAELAQATAST